MDQPPASERRRFAALGYRDFRVLWFGMLFASGTMAFQYYAQMWLIYSLSSSALLLGVLGATRGAATLLFGLYGGALADRMDRRLLLMVTEAVALVVNATLGLLAITGVIELWQALTLVFIGSATASIDAPVRQAIIPELVPSRHIPNAVALTTAARMGTFAFAPVLAGAVIQAIGPGGAYAASPFGNAAVIAALLALRYRGHPMEARQQSVLRNIRDGLVYTRENRMVLWIIVMMFAMGALGMSIYQGLIVKWASEVLHLDPGQYGVLAWFWGLGTLAVAYTLSFMTDVPRRGRLLIFASIVFGLSFSVFGLTRWLPLAALAYLVNGAAWTATSITAAALIQRSVTNEMRGRVMSLYMVNSAGAQLNGMVLGALAGVVGIEVLLPGATIACTLLLILLALAVPTLRRLDRHVPAQPEVRAAAEPAPQAGMTAPGQVALPFSEVRTKE
jgi:MFS family permease